MDVLTVIEDMSHLLAINVLLVKILRTGSVSGLSGISQLFYAIVYSTRYLDIFIYLYSVYNILMKCIYFNLTYLTVFLIFKTHKDTYDRKNDPKKSFFILIFCLVLALLVNEHLAFTEVMRPFSFYLEAVAMVPQLWMVNKTGECKPVTFHYIFCLCVYKAFFLLNRYFDVLRFDIALWSGIVQMLTYFAFFYMYATKVIRGNKFRGYLQLEQNDLLETRNKVAVVSSTVGDKPQGKVDVVV